MHYAVGHTCAQQTEMSEMSYDGEWRAKPTKYIGRREAPKQETFLTINVSYILALWGASCCVMYTHIFQIHARNHNWQFIGVIFLLVHNMFRPLRAIFRWNTITVLIHLEKAIDITTDPLFHNLSLIIYLYNGKYAFYFKMNWL
jgi:hypothetical protein